MREVSVLKLLVSVLASEARVVSYCTFLTSVSVTLACSAAIYDCNVVIFGSAAVTLKARAL